MKLKRKTYNFCSLKLLIMLLASHQLNYDQKRYHAAAKPCGCFELVKTRLSVE